MPTGDHPPTGRRPTGRPPTGRPPAGGPSPGGPSPGRPASLRPAAVTGLAAGIYGAALWIAAASGGIRWVAFALSARALAMAAVAAVLVMLLPAAVALLAVGGTGVLRGGRTLRTLRAGAWLTVLTLPLHLVLRPSVGSVVYGNIPPIVAVPFVAAGAAVLILMRRADTAQ
ncbi:hypothetical protein [Mangrovihabitans endophyticus]|nr:hypothetical protein [Mangrovihabitans endophyticus]